MKALVKYARGKGNMEVRQVAERRLAANEVRIQVEATGICGSDLHIFHDEIKIPIQIPVVVGHEFSGRVSEVGKQVEQVRVGERVTAMPSVRVCGTCRYCRTGSYNLCIRRESMGYWHDGSFARTCVVPARCVLRLPKAVDFRAGALTEPLACAVHAVTELTGISAGDLVAIVGPGTIGLLCLQVIKAEGGIAFVCGLSRDQERLELARQLGADYVVDVEREDAVAKIEQLSQGYGADVVLECSGAQAGVSLGLECSGAQAGVSLGLELVRKQGSYTQVGLFGRPIQVDLDQVAFKELKLTGSLGQKPTAWERALKLMETGKIDSTTLISREISLDDWQEAFALFERQEGIKLLLDVKD